MELKFDFADDDRVTGFRLAHFEAYNWGTYDKSIVTLSLEKNNGLLTGDIGSGKSTLVDALTTLLVPHQKIIYNKAAGAETRERSLYSYVVGEYKSSQDENFGNAKAVALRDSSSFSVLLARFENEGFDESLSIAQFFYIVSNQVNKFFVVSQGDIGIKKDFFNFNDIRELKKRLRNYHHTRVYDSFKEYAKDFSRVMGIKNDQALNLFYQTVSLKSIGNLTQFLRTHMLEISDTNQQVETLCSNFSDLNHTHELVVKAKEQIALLTPISKESKRYKGFEEEIEKFHSMSEVLPLYIATYKKALLEVKLKELGIALTKANSSRVKLQEQLEKFENDITTIKVEIGRNGGDRLNQIESEIKHTSTQLEVTKKANESYNGIVKALGLGAVSNEHRFLHTLEALSKEYEEIDADIDTIDNKVMFEKHSIDRYATQKREIDMEILYLEAHPSNIPQRVAKIRDEMAEHLGVEREALPFVGELINVIDEEWGGAIERVLHNFALSLIVDKALYGEVTTYVDSTKLKGKLVYLKVDKTVQTNTVFTSVPHSILDKLELKVDSPFINWLNAELYHHFNISCVRNLEEFRRFKKALSINGQFKTNLVRHEKDDRYAIEDKTRWVLGWDNLVKLQQFQQEKQALEEKVTYSKSMLVTNEKLKKEMQTKRDYLRDALKYETFEMIDWYGYSKLIEQLQDEKYELEKSNDVIKSLQERLIVLQKEKEESKLVEASKNKEIGKLEQKIEDRSEELNDSQLLLDNGKLNEESKKQIDTLKDEVHNEPFTLVNINSTSKKMKEKIDKASRNTHDKKERSGSKILEGMNTFIRLYPIESKEFDATIASVDDFEQKLQSLKKDNLPKWQKKFKELLKEKTIQGIVILQSTLEEYAKNIIEKIEKINLSLKDIEYSEGTFIELIAQKSNIAEIKAFKEKLKSITTGAISEENSYDEQKFLEIKDLIARFNGREGSVDVDKKWRNLVTDVRNWFDFSASERYISDGVQKEYYAHSGGKSGGQKEKLAYTVLASSLAYQFGLEYEKVQSRSFRFVMIDEAFGRGSDESTRYALRLFESLRLQLLVITPKQKINVIEPYVDSVHFVHNQDGMDSSLLSMKIEEYQKKKQL